jgi:polyphosphate kinase
VAAPRTKKRRGERRLLNRELSQLAAHERVLELAADSDVPILERVKFCAIVSRQLDEFFMVRVGALAGQLESGLVLRSADGMTAAETLGEIRQRVLELSELQARLWTRDVEPALAAEGIVIGRVEDLEESEREELAARFEREVFPVLTPLAVGPGQPFPYISGLSISLAVFVRDPETGAERFARVKVPEGLPRFVSVGTRGIRIPLERVISHFLPALFPGMEVLERTLFRVTRDADFEVSDEADDLLEAVEVELRRRRFGEIVRMEVSSSTSQAMLARLQTGLGVPDDEVYPIRGPLDLADAWEIALIDRPDLRDDTWVPVTREPFASMVASSDWFDAVRASEALVHHPYDSFATSVEAFMDAAASDPDVLALKTTVYRTGDESPLVPALIQAAENGKQSVCLVELKARFDEHRNIEWSRKLEEAGVHVVYGFPSLKIHAKTTLVVRREPGGLRRYVHLATGNYHSVTARTYEDFGLFTCDEEVAADVADLFNYLTGFGHPGPFRKILVAPFTLRDRIAAEIRAVAAAAGEGKPARIRMKLNALTDPTLIEELYAASIAGARIELVVRSLCSLVPGLAGLSENIEVRSVYGRFLEHSRIYAFEAGERTTMFMGSADLMPRNLDHRIEVVVPVADAAHREELVGAIDLLLKDTAGAWRLRSDGRWERIRPQRSEKPRSAQDALMRRARRRGARPLR